MIIFQHKDKKFLNIQSELKKLGINSDAVNTHPVLAPFFVLKNIIKGKKVKLYVFRYINDSDSLFLAYIRLISEFVKIGICKIFNIEIWWLCHNVDQETVVHFPKITKLRRNNIVNYSKRIFTTNKMIVPFAQQMFASKFVDSLSLGFISDSLPTNPHSLNEVELEIERWIKERQNTPSKFIFCIGSDSGKSIHFQRVTSFIEKLNNESNLTKWYAVVVGKEVKESQYIYNVGYKYFINTNFVKQYADFYYRVISDYSISYSIFEAVKFRIPIITEDFGVLPQIIEHYNIGVVLNEQESYFNQVTDLSVTDQNFLRFENENNWNEVAKKIQHYYNIDTN